MLRITPRSVIEKDGLRPFQKKTLDALCSDARVIVVEAPVGSGKSHIVRQAIEGRDKAVVLTYPTKILMDNQLKALKNDFPESVVWPFDDTTAPTNNSPTIFYYSTDSLISFLKKQNTDYRLDRSELLDTFLRQQFWAARKNLVVTSPDVLHLLFSIKAYRGSQNLLSLFTKSLVVFDEFHLYVGLRHFLPLIENLFEKGVEKIVLLSATPVITEEMQTLFDKYKTVTIDFSDSIGSDEDCIFNYPLNLEFVNCRFTRKAELISVLKKYVPTLPKPMAIILDSVFRLRHIMPALRREFPEWRLIEYSGFSKDSTFLDDKTILVGTSSIEVGINMVFKSLITEASYWTSAIQRIGRAGRFCNGNVIVLTTKNMAPYLDGKLEISRDDLENSILKSAMKDMRMTSVSGDMFRGDSYNFLLYDIDLMRLTTYSEAIFAIYEPNKWIDNWQSLDFQKKRELLRQYTSQEGEISDILLRDRLNPLWGVIEGRLRDRYENVDARLEDDELIILCRDSNKQFYFDRGR